MKRIALLSDGWKRMVTYSWMNGIMMKVKELGIDVCLDQFNTNGNWSLDERHNAGEYNLYQLPDLSKYDGIIFDCSNMTDQKQIDRIVNRLKTVSVPVVSISYAVDGFYYVGNDNKRLFRKVLDHMHDCHNCKSYVFAGGPAYNYENRMRYEAFIEAMNDYGIEVNPENILFGDFDFGSGEQYFQEWLDSGKAFPDCFICANDNIAAGLCSAAIKNNFSIPEDFRVTGFDNLDKAAYFLPQIMTVEHNRGNIGKNAVQILLDLWEGKEVPAFTYLYSECIPGESCGCPNSGRVDYRIYIKWQIELAVKRDYNEENIMVLEKKLKDCENYKQIFSKFSDYIENLGCDGLYLVMDERLLEAPIQENFETSGYNMERMKVAYASENGNELSQFQNYNELRDYLDENGVGSAYFYSSIHFRDRIIGFSVLKNPVFLYDNPCFYDVLSVFQGTLEDLYKQVRLENINAKMAEIYNKDALTGLYNRIAYQDMILPKFEDYKRQGIACSMVFFDADNFKTLNDTYGHMYGDEVLKKIAGIIVANSPKDGYSYRFGGDEFVVFFPNTEPSKLQNFLDAVSGEFEREKLEVSQGVIITDPFNDKSLEDYLVMADLHMYEVKQKRHKKF